MAFRYFEDYVLGLKGITSARTVTEADIVNFACLTGDYSTPHMDHHTMVGSIYGSRVAHGLLGMSLMTGMLSLRAPHILGRGVPGAYCSGFSTNYHKAIKLGDTIRTTWEVAHMEAQSPHPGYGKLSTAFHVIGEDGSPVYDGNLRILVPKYSDREAKLQLQTNPPWELKGFVPEPDKFYYVEDYPIGEGGETGGRTVTEADIVTFAGLTGDFNPQQVNREFALHSMFGERIASGMMIFSFIFGQWISERTTGLPQPLDVNPEAPMGVVAGHLNDTGDFTGAVKIGDTIRCRYKTMFTRVSKTKRSIGLITTGFQAINQRNEVVLEGSTILMGIARPITQAS